MKTLAACLTALALSFPALAEDQISPRMITVTGQAEEQFAPDRAEITVVLEGRGKTVAEAKKKHDDLLNGLLIETKEFGVPEKQVITISDTIQPQYDYIENQGQKLREYVAEHRVLVKLDAIKKVGDFINAVVARKVDKIEGVSYTLKDNKAATRQVLLKAVADAKDKAQAIAQTLGVSLGAVQSLDASGGSYNPPPMPFMKRQVMAVAADAAQESAAPVPPGDVNITQNVSASFLIN